MSNLDRSLDDIISSKKKPFRGGRVYRGGISRRGVGRKVSGPYERATRAPAPVPLAKKVVKPDVPAVAGGTKIIVSGFPQDVSRDQILELFRETIGPIVSLTLSFDAKGNSRGIAEVEFKTTDLSQKAYHQFNGRMIDNKFKMKVEMVVDPSKVPPKPLATRLNPGPSVVSAALSAPISGRAPMRGRGFPARRARAGRIGRGGRRAPLPTAEDLDVQMDDYIAAGQAEKQA